MSISDIIIREARLRAGLTQQQLAKRIETTQSAVARWERGRVEPSLETLRKIVAQCGLDLNIALRVRDPDESTLIDANLRLTPEERLDQLVRTVSFIEAGRRALDSAGG